MASCSSGCVGASSHLLRCTEKLSDGDGDADMMEEIRGVEGPTGRSVGRGSTGKVTGSSASPQGHKAGRKGTSDLEDLRAKPRG